MSVSQYHLILVRAHEEQLESLYIRFSVFCFEFARVDEKFENRGRSKQYSYLVKHILYITVVYEMYFYVYIHATVCVSDEYVKNWCGELKCIQLKPGGVLVCLCVVSEDIS